MNGDETVSRLWWNNRVVIAVLVVLLVVSGTVLWQSLQPTTAGAAGAPKQSKDAGVGFRIVGSAKATQDPAQFTTTSFVVPDNRAVDITDVVLQNPHQDAGTMRILIADEILLEVDLAELTDRHYAVPLHVNGGEPVSVAMSCQLPGPPEPATGDCAPSASFFG